MKKEIDEVLKHALTPKEEPDFWLNQKILNQVKERNRMGMQKAKRIPAVVLSAALLLAAGSMTAYAAWKYLTPEKVSEQLNEQKLTDAFLSEDAIAVNETQSFGGYNITLLGIVSGKELIEFHKKVSNGHVSLDKTYCVVAIEHSDGTPMPDTSEDAYAELSFFVSPLVKGYPPMHYNAASMHGGYTDITEDGILYRLAECDNVEMFADCGLYLCVCDSVFYNGKAYNYDETTGEISRNEDYTGLNALFYLPIDESKADPAAAAEYIKSLGFNEKEHTETGTEYEISEETDKSHEEFKEVILFSGNEKGAALAEYALQFVGNPYVWGGDSLTEGTDCSGFVKSVYEQFGISLPHSADRQKEQGSEVKGLENAEAGDLIFYKEPSHVAIYIGEGKIVHADPADGICVSAAEEEEVLLIRRIFEEE